MIKVERPDGGDTLRGLGWRDPRDGVTLWWKLAGAQQALHRPRPEGRPRPRRLARASSTRPTCWSRTSGRARSSASASGPTCSIAAQPAARHHPGHRLRPGRPLRRPARASPPSPRPCAASPPSTASPTAVRSCPRSPSPTRSPAWSPPSPRWSRCTPASGQVVDVNLLESLFQLMGPLHRRLPAARLRAAPARLAASPTRCPAAPTACADGAVGGDLDLGRDGRPAGDGADRRRRRRPVRRPSTAASRTATSSTRRRRLVGARPLGGGAGRVRGGPCRRRARLRRWPTSPPTRTTASAGPSSSVDGVPMQGLIARLSATPGRLRWAGRPLDADGPAIRAELDQEQPPGPA